MPKGLHCKLIDPISVLCIRILQALLTGHVHTLVTKGNPRLLFRSTETVAEKLLANWLCFLLYPYVQARDIITAIVYAYMHNMQHTHTQPHTHTHTHTHTHNHTHTHTHTQPHTHTHTHTTTHTHTQPHTHTHTHTHTCGTGCGQVLGGGGYCTLSVAPKNHSWDGPVCRCVI